MNRAIAIAAAALLCAPVAAGYAGAAEIVCLSPGATESSLSEIVPQFEQASGHQVKVSYGSVGALANRVKNGEAADVVILAAPVAEELRAAGKLVAGSEVVVAKVGVGVFVRKGDPKPDVSSLAAFMSALQAAKAISYSDPALGGSAANYVAGLMNTLDVTGAIKPKTKLVPPAKPLADLVAGGGADFGLNQISEILADPRLELVGPLPAEIQNYTNYVASVAASSRQPDAGKALIDYLASPPAAAVMRSKGFEPL
jgi:molybdate transport system substrate-binding protein